jgi:hypothetical protein
MMLTIMVDANVAIGWLIMVSDPDGDEADLAMK